MIVEIKNNTFLQDLTNFSDSVFAWKDRRKKEIDEDLKLQRDVIENKDLSYYTSEEYLKKVVDSGMLHSGFPRYSLAVSMDKSETADNELTKARRILFDRLAAQLNFRVMALCFYYPPKGFISWHTNWNVPGQNIILTYSTSEDSFFRYVDPKTKEVVTINDKLGWNCKMTHYGSRRQPDHILYHCAEAKSDRITVGLSFVQQELNLPLHESIKEYISNGD